MVNQKSVGDDKNKLTPKSVIVIAAYPDGRIKLKCGNQRRNYSAPQIYYV